VTILQQIEKFWTDFLGFLSTIIIPDWTGLIALLPLFLLIGVIGPILSIILLAWLGYSVTKPRTKVKYEEQVVRPAPLNHLGEPIFPSGEPYCPNDGLIYPFGATRCDRDKTPLSLRCPKCELVREASVEACGNCGLILKLQPRALIIAGDRPPPGGAALA
jgi:hypothetical protein